MDCLQTRMVPVQLPESTVNNSLFPQKYLKRKLVRRGGVGRGERGGVGRGERVRVEGMVAGGKKSKVMQEFSVFIFEISFFFVIFRTPPKKPRPYFLTTPHK